MKHDRAALIWWLITLGFVVLWSAAGVLWWLITLGFVVLWSAAGVLWSWNGHAAPPPGATPTGAEAEWWGGAINPRTKTPCCGQADGQRVVARHDSDEPITGWSILRDGQWVQVPPNRVLAYPPHPAGISAAWFDVRGEVTCFIAGTGAR